MKLADASSIFRPRLEIERDAYNRPKLIDTTGNQLDFRNSAILPKAAALIDNDSNGQQFIHVQHNQQDILVPREAFEETDGENGVFYLPTYQDSTTNAALSGAMRGFLAAGPIGAVSGLGGAAAMKLVGDSRPGGRATKFAASTLTGAALVVAGQAALYGSQNLPLAALIGGASGLGAALAGAGDAKTRDALYGGAAAGMAVSMMTGAPMTSMLIAGTASGIGAQANSKVAQAVTSAVISAGLNAAQAALTGSNIGMATALGAAAGLIGPLLGPPVMQLTRNLTQVGSQHVQKAVADCSDLQLELLSAVPSAASFGLLGAAAGLVNPNLAAAGAAIGISTGAAIGFYKAHQRIEELKRDEELATRQGPAQAKFELKK
jgi:hypothetical protein